MSLSTTERLVCQCSSQSLLPCDQYSMPTKFRASTFLSHVLETFIFFQKISQLIVSPKALLRVDFGSISLKAFGNQVQMTVTDFSKSQGEYANLLKLTVI